jgi:hypothetical protein
VRDLEGGVGRQLRGGHQPYLGERLQLRVASEHALGLGPLEELGLGRTGIVAEERPRADGQVLLTLDRKLQYRCNPLSGRLERLAGGTAVQATEHAYSEN